MALDSVSENQPAAAAPSSTGVSQEDADSINHDATDAKSVDGNKSIQEENDQQIDEEQKIDIENEVELLKQELDKIRVYPPVTVSIPTDDIERDSLPLSYKENSPKEKAVLGYAENYRRQYMHLYRDRKPLLLNPFNECGTEKFVSTTIHPTRLPFQELFDWHGAAEFVADYLNFTQLQHPDLLPTHLYSPMTVLNRQLGHSFEYSTLLASLLIGSGYDAYVVSGYATKEICLADQSREICPWLVTAAKTEMQQKKEDTKKYVVRPPKDLQSKFEIKQEMKRKKKMADDEEKRRKEEEDAQLLREQPPPDPLYGLRVHSWVLVLEGRRDVGESFFVEPLTGLPYPVNSPHFLGIESVWNHQNYWANMQDCSEGVKNMRYDLGDCSLWEFMFPSNEKPQLLLPDENHYNDDMEDNLEEEEPEKHLDLPQSWTKPIELSKRDFQLRCPNGKKTALYKRAKIEKFSPYLLKDGLVNRLTQYDDMELTQLLNVKEFFANRVDKLRERFYDNQTSWTVEYFNPGRELSLKEHHYKVIGPTPDGARTMIFYDKARVDGLQKRVQSQTELHEYFVNREDFLYYRFAEFGAREKKFGPAEYTPRPLVRMIEKFSRNRSKEANDDIAEITYNIVESRIFVVYHRDDEKITASVREFINPTATDEKGYPVWNADKHCTFQADPSIRQKKNVKVYELMLELMKCEQICKQRVRDSEAEIQEILNERMKEEASTELDVSVYDTDRNEKQNDIGYN